MKTSVAFVLAVLALEVAAFGQAKAVRLIGSTTAAQAFQAAAPAIKKDLGIDLKFEPQSLSSIAINALGTETADLAILTRAVTQEDRSEFPARRFFEIEIGVQVLVPLVSRETWSTGVKTISKNDFAAIYEGQLKSWKQLGGEERDIKFFNPERGRGVWELFVTWLYGDIRKAPLGKKWEIVLTNQDARDSVEFNNGSISVAPPKWADGKKVFALALRDGAETIEPSVENFRSKKWPMTRPVSLVTGDKPTGNLRHLIQFMVGPGGRAALEKAEFVALPDAESKLGDS